MAWWPMMQLYALEPGPSGMHLMEIKNIKTFMRNTGKLSKGFDTEQITLYHEWVHVFTS
jgi:hypothetical protein